MKVYLLRRATEPGYDEWYGCVVVAKDEFEARRMHPQGSSYVWENDGWCSRWFGKDGVEQTFRHSYDGWVSPEAVVVCDIGVPNEDYLEPRVVIASFKAG
jgi:hypothetical protein